MKYRTLLRRARLLAMLAPIAIDCLGNLLVGGSWRNTISSEAWNNRAQRWWGAARLWIDWAFSCPVLAQMEHCKAQAELEAHFGSVWHLWASEWATA